MKEEGSPTSRIDESVRGLLALALRCETEGPTYALDAAIKAPVRGGGGIPKPYTTSLDAAVTLVPEGWRAMLWIDGGFGGQARVIQKGEPFDGPRCDAIAKTPALALCAAALRARAEIGKAAAQEASAEGEARANPNLPRSVP